jgi:hypothetical protein
MQRRTGRRGTDPQTAIIIALQVVIVLIALAAAFHGAA